MTIEERAKEKIPENILHMGLNYAKDLAKRAREFYIQGAKDQLEIDKEVINMLIDILQTSKNYHLGITGLDSEEEIIEKRRTRETALIRNIESKIEQAKEAMEG